MIINANTTYGGDAGKSRNGCEIVMSFETNDEKIIKACADLGAASLLYRGGASMFNSVLGVKNNTDIDYSDAVAAKVRDAAIAWFAKGCPAKKGDKVALPAGVSINITVTEYEPGEGAVSPMVRATEFVDTMLANDGGEAQVRAVLGFYDAGAAEADRAGLIAIAHKSMFAAKKKVKAEAPAVAAEATAATE